jgi:hypothetical protein
MDLANCSATALLSLLAARDVAAEELVEAHVRAIDEGDGENNALAVPRFERAIGEAATIDKPARSTSSGTSNYGTSSPPSRRHRRGDEPQLPRERDPAHDGSCARTKGGLPTRPERCQQTIFPARPTIRTRGTDIEGTARWDF